VQPGWRPGKVAYSEGKCTERYSLDIPFSKGYVEVLLLPGEASYPCKFRAVSKLHSYTRLLQGTIADRLEVLCAADAYMASRGIPVTAVWAPDESVLQADFPSLFQLPPSTPLRVLATWPTDVALSSLRRFYVKVLYRTVLVSTVLYCTLLYSTLLCSTVLGCTVQPACIFFSWTVAPGSEHVSLLLLFLFLPGPNRSHPYPIGEGRGRGGLPLGGLFRLRTTPASCPSPSCAAGPAASWRRHVSRGCHVSRGWRLQRGGIRPEDGGGPGAFRRRECPTASVCPLSVQNSTVGRE